MDQDPNTVGGAASDPGQNSRFFNEPTPTTSNMPDLSPASESPFAPEPVAGAPEPIPTVAAIATEPALPTVEPSTPAVPENPAVQATAPAQAPETNQVVMGQPAAPAPATPLTRPVESNYIERDLRLPGDKKPKTALIIGAIAGGVALVLTCVAVWFFAIYSHPQKVIFDGVSNILKAKNVAINGGGSIALREKNPNAIIQSALLNFNSSSSKLPNSTDVSLYLQFADDKSINIQLGTVQMNDGVIYVKISGIMDSLRRMGIDPDDTSGAAYAEDLMSFIETVDGEWWRISVRDILRETTSNEKIANIYGDLYDCVLRASTRDNSNEIIDLIKQHPFVDVTPVKRINSPNAFNDYDPVAWHKLYEIKFKSAELADFINALPRTAAANEIYACYNTAIQAYDAELRESMGSYGSMSASKQISADDFEKIDADDIKIDEKVHIFVEAAQFGHKIRSIWAYAENETFNNSLAVTLDYKDAVVSAPDNYRDVTELFDELPIEDAWSSFTMSGLGGYGATYGNPADNCNGLIDPPTNCLEPYYDDDFNADDYFGNDSDFLPISNEIEAI